MRIPMRASALLLDLDGTLYDAHGLIPAADEAVRRIRSAGMPIRFVTNTTRRSRADVHEDLARLGIDLSLDELFTAPVAASRYLERKGYSKILPLFPDATLSDFKAFEVVERDAEAVVVGDLGDAWDFRLLNGAFRALMDGAELIAIQKNRYWKEADGLSLDAGPFVAALEYAAGLESVVVGKPSRVFFEGAVQSMDASLGDAVMVGDDLHADVSGAQEAGLRGILVRTGKFRADELERSGVRPDAVIDSIAELPALLGLEGN